MQGWGEYIAAFAVFFLSHTIPVRPAVKGRIAARIGAGGFTLAYSMLSVIVLIWLIVAAGRAPVLVLWSLPAWAGHLTLGVMLAAVLVFALAVARPNPLSFGGAGNATFDPAIPGIVGWLRHPLLWVLLLWSLAHLLPNGDLAHVLMFGAFAAFSLMGMRLIDRRKRRQMGEAEWARLAALPRRVEVTRGGVARVIAGLAVYAALIWLHGPVIGAYPLG